MRISRVLLKRRETADTLYLVALFVGMTGLLIGLWLLAVTA